MLLQLIGVSYKTAGIALREAMALDADAQTQFLIQARTIFPGSEWFILSTCNRSEYYWVLPEDNVAKISSDGADACESTNNLAVLHWLHQQVPLTATHAYQLTGLAVVRHFISVLCGLDSMVLGESQIVAQVKAAIDIASHAGSLGKCLHALLQQAQGAAKKIRKQTGIGDSATSVAYTAVLLARSIFSDFSPLHVLLIGAGDTAELTAWHLRQQGVTQMTILNRQAEKARAMAEKWQCQGSGLDALPDVLPHADIVISATSSQSPIISYAMLSDALAKRRRAVYLIDLAIPRDIEPTVADLTQVYLYNMDDLQQVVAEGLQAREQAAVAALPLIDAAIASFAAYQADLAATDSIVSLQTHAQLARESELNRARAMLARGEDMEAVLQQLTHRLSNKLLHHMLMLLKT